MSKTTFISCLLIVALAAFIYGNKGPDSFAECLLERLPGTVSDISALGSISVCKNNHPGGMDKQSEGSGFGLLGYKDRFECMSIEARSTRSRDASKAIGRACNHLYTIKSSEKKQTGPWEKY